MLAVVLRIRKPVESALICTTLIKDSHRDISLLGRGNTNTRTTKTSYEKLWPFARPVSQEAIRYSCGPQRAKVSQGLQISSQCRMRSRYVGVDNRVGDKNLAAAKSFTTSTMRDHKWLYVVTVFCPKTLGVCTLMLVVQMVRNISSRSQRGTMTVASQPYVQHLLDIPPRSDVSGSNC